MYIKLEHLVILLLCFAPVTNAFADNPADTAGKKNTSVTLADAVSKAVNSEEAKEIPVLKRQIHQGETITADDIMYDNRLAKRIHDNVITDAKELIGKSAKHAITQGRPVRLDEVANPAILLKNTRVTMLYKSQNLEIRTVGEALDSGAKGDVVRVRNLSSKTVIDATVLTGDTVRVSSPESNAAEAM